MAGLDVINRRIAKHTIRERIKKAYTDPNRPKKQLPLPLPKALTDGPFYEVQVPAPKTTNGGVFYIYYDD